MNIEAEKYDNIRAIAKYFGVYYSHGYIYALEMFPSFKESCGSLVANQNSCLLTF